MKSILPHVIIQIGVESISLDSLYDAESIDYKKNFQLYGPLQMKTFLFVLVLKGLLLQCLKTGVISHLHLKHVIFVSPLPTPPYRHIFSVLFTDFCCFFVDSLLSSHITRECSFIISLVVFCQCNFFSSLITFK